MKNIYSFLLMLFASVNVLTANSFKQQITPADLGYTDAAYILYYEQIDESNLGLIVEYIKDSEMRKASWVYDLNARNAIDVTYQDSLKNRFDILWSHVSDYSFYGFENFLRDGDLIYNIVYHPGSENYPENGLYLLSTHLITKQQKVQFLQTDCDAKLGFLQSDVNNYIVQSNTCDASFRLIEFDDTSWNVVWRVEDFGDEKIFNFDTEAPFYHQGKIYLSAQHQLYVFNTSDHNVDTLIDNTRDANGVTEECLSIPMQYFAHGDDVYVVYRDVEVYYLFVNYIAVEGEGYTRIWKTDGTKTGTQLFSRIPKADDMKGMLLHSRFLEMDDRLLWLGDVDTLNDFQIYDVKEGMFDPLGTVKYMENSAFTNYNSPYSFYKNLLYNDIVPVRFKDQDVLPIIQLVITPEEKYINYLSLIGLDGNQLKIFKENFLLSSDETDEDGYVWNVTDARVWNLDEKLVISRFGEMTNVLDTRNKLDFLISDDYRIIEFDTISLGYESPIAIMHSFKVGNDLFFNYGEEDGNLIIWSLSEKVATGTKNQTSSNRLKLSVYPNPTAGNFIIQSPEFMSGQMMIVGVDGKVYQSFRMNGHQQQINVSKLVNGMYIAIYQEGQDITHQRFIVHR